MVVEPLTEPSVIGSADNNGTSILLSVKHPLTYYCVKWEIL